MSTESATDSPIATDSTSAIGTAPTEPTSDALPTSLSLLSPIVTPIIPTTTRSSTQTTTTFVNTSTSTSSISTSTTAPPPTSVTSPTSTSWTPTMPSGIPTTITSSYITIVGGSTYTTQSLIQSIIPTQSSTTSDHRAAIIAGTAAGAALFIIILVATLFYFRRKHFKRLRILDAITSSRDQALKRAMLLADEDLDDIDLSHHPPAGGYPDYGTPWDTGSPQGSISDRSFIPHGFGFHSGHGPSPSPSISRSSDLLTPTLHQSRRSETGPLFQKDPPDERSSLVNPLLHSPETDLSRIMDDVMGPSPPSKQLEYQPNVS